MATLMTRRFAILRLSGSITDSSVFNLILLDVFHHLTYPGTALKEFHRVLRVNGRVTILEPAMSLLGKLVYGLFHYQPLGLLKPVSWLSTRRRPATTQLRQTLSRCF
jgi:ubiquinone/menaquinone biosynthesis C-methylase UbiE